METIGELVPAARLTDIVMNGIPKDYPLVKLSAIKDPDYNLEQMEATMRNLLVNDISQDDDHTNNVMGGAAMTAAAQVDGNRTMNTCRVSLSIPGMR